MAEKKVLEQVNDTVVELAAQVPTMIESVIDAVAPVLASAKDAVASQVDQGKEAIAAAGPAAAATLAEVAEKAGAAEKEKSRGGGVTKLLLVLGAAGIGALVLKKLMAKDEDPWQSTYVPPAAPAAHKAEQAPPTEAPPAESVADLGAAAPDEFLADNEAPREPSTPDAPLTEVDVTEVEDPKV